MLSDWFTWLTLLQPEVAKCYNRTINHESNSLWSPYFLMSHSDRLALLQNGDHNMYGLLCTTYRKLTEWGNWKVLQANTSMLQPATMQPCLAYNSTPTQPYSSCNPTLRLQGVRLTVAILYCVYKHQEHSQHSCYCFYNLSIQCSWVFPTTATIPSTHQPVSSWCHLSVHIYMLNYCALATLHNQTNTHPSKVIICYIN